MPRTPKSEGEDAYLHYLHSNQIFKSVIFSQKQRIQLGIAQKCGSGEGEDNSSRAQKGGYLGGTFFHLL